MEDTSLLKTPSKQDGGEGTVVVEKEKIGLKRQVNLLGGICMLVGSIIGSGTRKQTNIQIILFLFTIN